MADLVANVAGGATVERRLVGFAGLADLPVGRNMGVTDRLSQVVHEGNVRNFV